MIAQQNAGSVTPPTGYSNYLGVTSQSAYSVGSGDFYVIGQPIEANNVTDLAWGTASAATVTLSFWVRSSLTGTFGGVVKNYAGTRSYPFTYTISSANTWEQKSVTIAGDTSGTWVMSGTGGSIYVQFGLGIGSTYAGTAGSWSGSNYQGATGAVSVVGTNGATFYITGVQLEKGTTASSFDFRSYGTELALCLRYFQRNSNSSLYAAAYVSYSAGNYLFTATHLPTKMRATPTVDTTGTTWSLYNCSTPNIYSASNDAINAQGLTTTSANCYFAGSGLYSLSAEL